MNSYVHQLRQVSVAQEYRADLARKLSETHSQADDEDCLEVNCLVVRSTFPVSGDQNCSSWNQFAYGTRFIAEKDGEILGLNVLNNNLTGQLVTYDGCNQLPYAFLRSSKMRYVMYPKDHRSCVLRIVLLCCVANFINAADRVIMPIAIIPISDHYKWDLHQHGWILSAFSIGYMSSMIIGGSAAKRYGGSTILLLAVLLWSLSSFVTPWFAYSSTALVVLRFLLGIGEGIGLPTIVHIFSLLVPVDERSRALGYLVAFGSFGQILATLVCPYLFWPLSFYLFGGFGFIWLFFWLLVFRDVRRCERMEEDFFTPQTRLSKPAVHWYEFLSRWPLWAIYIAHFSMNWSNYIIMQWLPTYLTRFLGAGKGGIMLTALPYLSNSVASIAAGHIADHFIKRQWSVLAVRRLMSCIGLIGPGLLLFLFSASTSISAAISIISMSMILSAFNSAGHLSNHVEVAPNHAGITFAISNTLASTAQWASLRPFIIDHLTKQCGNEENLCNLRKTRSLLKVRCNRISLVDRPCILLNQSYILVNFQRTKIG
ncbi:probable anion transporter 4 chloroplastic [Clonorchis sinensis]|uniref:Probable anion transporter 4 chloroplastic n=1 Tax=Clonorchis sinensis TaxID=79923 RepID=G7Y6B3_CLOSI|nr:probable anion transporter 4 chloroplastic [Clonorchis sinensis]